MVSDHERKHADAVRRQQLLEESEIQVLQLKCRGMKTHHYFDLVRKVHAGKYKQSAAARDSQAS